MRATLFLCLFLTLFAAPAIAQIEGRLMTTQIQSASFAGNRIGLSPIRNITVYLPPHYGETRRRFPVVYFLNYFFEDEKEPFASHGAKELLNKAIASGVIGDIIVVT